MRIVLTLAIAPLALGMTGCGTDDPSATAAQRGKPVVVAGFWPLAELARELGGDAVVVVNMTPVGEPAHDLELTPRQREEVVEASLAIVMGGRFQPDVEDAAARREGPTVDVLAALDLPDRPDDEPGPRDVHVWLDPTIMGSIATLVADELAAVVPDDADEIRARGDDLVERYVELDARFEQGLEDCARSVIASQHDAFGWLAARYGLTAIGFDTAAPDDDLEPDAAQLDAITPLLEDGSITTLFTETLQPGSWIELLADEHGLDTAVLNPYEGLTAREDANEVDYEGVLLYDLRVLRDHLDCER